MNPSNVRAPFTIWIALLFGALAPPAVAQTWTLTGNLNVSRLGPTATVLTDGRVLVAGGESVINGSGPGLNSAEIYNPATGTWTLTPNMTAVHSGAAAVRLTDGRVLLCGSNAGLVQSNICEIYDPISGTWTQTGSMNGARGFQNAVGLVLLANGKVLATAGISGGGPTNAAELYDPSTGTWQVTGSLPVSIAGPSATLLPNGQVLVAGGNDNFGVFPNAELYDPSSGLWTPTGPLNQARAQHIGVLLGNGKVLVAGGRIGRFSTCCTQTATAELYDPGSGTWTLTSSMSVARDSHQAVFLNNGQVLVTGGLSAAFTTVLNTTEIYNPGSGTWSAAPSMNQARTGHGAALLLDGRILVAGGADSGSNSLNSAETLGPIYGVCVLYDQTRSVKSGAVFPIKIELCDVNGTDVSSSAIVVHATQITSLSSFSGTPEDVGNANPDNDFRFDSTLGTTGGYIFNLSTTGLASGTYSLQFTAAGDPVTHSVNFGVK